MFCLTNEFHGVPRLQTWWQVVGHPFPCRIKERKTSVAGHCEWRSNKQPICHKRDSPPRVRMKTRDRGEAKGFPSTHVGGLESRSGRPFLEDFQLASNTRTRKTLANPPGIRVFTGFSGRVVDSEARIHFSADGPPFAQPPGVPLLGQARGRDRALAHNASIRLPGIQVAARFPRGGVCFSGLPQAGG